MYARRYDDHRGSFNPPMNYSGNAFSDDSDDSIDENVENPSNVKPSAAPQQEDKPVQETSAKPSSPPSQQTFLHTPPQYQNPPPIPPPPIFQNPPQYQNQTQFHPPEAQSCPHIDQCDLREPHDACVPTKERPRGILDGLFSRFGNNFNLDDLLLIGLILLLSSGQFGNDCDNNDDLLLILGLLLIIGF